MSIGDLARTAGISTRAVRHYHAVGLLPEPERDSSGYRRYGAMDVIALVRIVRLRNVGMPIPKIAEQLRAETRGGADAPLSSALLALAPIPMRRTVSATNVASSARPGSC